MQFQILYVEFDFDGELTPYERDTITAECIGQVWEADDEDDLVEEITCATGWCIKTLDYRHILN